MASAYIVLVNDELTYYEWVQKQITHLFCDGMYHTLVGLFFSSSCVRWRMIRGRGSLLLQMTCCGIEDLDNCVEEVVVIVKSKVQIYGSVNLPPMTDAPGTVPINCESSRSLQWDQ